LKVIKAIIITRHHRGSRPRGTFRPVLLFLFGPHLHLPSAVSLATPILVSTYATVSCSRAFLLPQFPIYSPSRSRALSPTRPFAAARPISALSFFLPLLSPSLPLALSHNFSYTHTHRHTHAHTHSHTRMCIEIHLYILSLTHTHTLTHTRTHTHTHIHDPPTSL